MLLLLPFFSISHRNAWGMPYTHDTLTNALVSVHCIHNTHAENLPLRTYTVKSCRWSLQRCLFFYKLWCDEKNLFRDFGNVLWGRLPSMNVCHALFGKLICVTVLSDGSMFIVSDSNTIRKRREATHTEKKDQSTRHVLRESHGIKETLCIEKPGMCAFPHLGWILKREKMHGTGKNV